MRPRKIRVTFRDEDAIREAASELAEDEIKYENPYWTQMPAGEYEDMVERRAEEIQEILERWAIYSVTVEFDLDNPNVLPKVLEA